ncbi:hypothetical protein KSP39_PZI003811 [Platanthera zijinensis]|uniref:Uncharacterized protein n=1 Tax=Platanthera zijinensis TaxID=2320716 RepID=A0AAP0BTY7_9ASPA
MRPRHTRFGLETVLEEDPSLGSEVEEELFLPSTGFESYLTFMRQIKSGLGKKHMKFSPFFMFFLLFVISFVTVFSYHDN